jgi:hypothetical protein
MTVEERKMRRRRVIKMTPPKESLCFVMLMMTMCLVLAAAQAPDLEEPPADGVYTDTTLTLGTGKYINKDANVLTHAASVCLWIKVYKMKNVVFCDVTVCRSCVNRRFGGPYRLHLQGKKIRERGTNVSRWLQI